MQNLRKFEQLPILNNQSQDENVGYIPFSFSLSIFPSSVRFAKI